MLLRAKVFPGYILFRRKINTLTKGCAFSQKNIMCSAVSFFFPHCGQMFVSAILLRKSLSKLGRQKFISFHLISHALLSVFRLFIDLKRVSQSLSVVLSKSKAYFFFHRRCLYSSVFSCFCFSSL